MAITNRTRNLLLTALCGLLAITVLTPLVSAQERESFTVTAGPHEVRVVPTNTNLAAGFFQLALFVTNSDTGEVVSDARVVLVAKNEEDDYEGWATAQNSPARPDRYDARMNLGSTGHWVIGVDVTSPLGTGGADVMTFDVPALNRYTSGSLVFFGIFAALMLGIVYLFWSVKRQNRRRREAAEG